jgi:hypothetical protein
MKYTFILFALSAFAFIGCENSSQVEGASWGSNPPSSPGTGGDAANNNSGAGDSAGGAADNGANAGTDAGSGSGAGSNAGTDADADASLPGDQMPYSSLKWTFGGFTKGANARHSGVHISSLSFAPSKLSFKYVKDLSAWGLSYTDASALSCMFVQKTDGTWVGGKFDWISSSRTSRGFTGHITPDPKTGKTYNGWSLAGVPNPCKAAFVIVSSDGTKRSNVIVGNWSR